MSDVTYFPTDAFYSFCWQANLRSLPMPSPIKSGYAINYIIKSYKNDSVSFQIKFGQLPISYPS